MNRREFITRLTAALPFASVAYMASADEVLSMQHKVIQSFVEQSATGKKHLITYYTLRKCEQDNQFSFGFKNGIIDNTDKEYDPTTVFNGDFPVLDYKGKYNAKKDKVCNIIRAANRIAAVTRRGRGNRFAQFPDHVLVWYQGHNPYDSPIQRIGKNIFLHPDYNNFFVKIDGIHLTESDISSLEYNRLKFVG